MTGRSWTWGLVVVSLLGLGLRAATVEAQSFWYDEAVTQQLIRQPIGDILRGAARDNGNPPLYLAAARVWQLALGEGDARLRWLSVLCGALTVPAVGLLGRRLVSPATGLGAAALYAVSPLALEFAHEARTYALLQLLATVNAWLFVRWLAERRTSDLAGYSVTLFLCGYSHYYAAFLPLAHLGAVLLVAPGRRAWLAWGGSLVVAGLLWSTWLPAFVTQLTTAGNLTRSGDTWKVQFTATPVAFALGRTFAWRGSLAGLMAVAGVGTLAAFVAPAVVGLARMPRRLAALLLGWLLLPVLVPLALAVLGKPVYSHRYAAIGLPAFVVCVAAGYVALRPGLRWVLVAAAAALTGVSLQRYAAEPLKDDWRSATPAIMAGSRPGDLMVFDTAIEVVTFQHYAGLDQPAAAVGLETTSADGPALVGIRYVAGRRVDVAVADRAAECFAADRVCLVLCVPKRPAEEYAERFRRHGYVPAGAADFHRIAVSWWVRPGGGRVSP